jgi:hypothetical protein
MSENWTKVEEYLKTLDPELQLEGIGERALAPFLPPPNLSDKAAAIGERLGTAALIELNNLTNDPEFKQQYVSGLASTIATVFLTYLHTGALMACPNFEACFRLPKMMFEAALEKAYKEALQDNETLRGPPGSIEEFIRWAAEQRRGK